MVCLENAKYRGTLGRNEGGWGVFKRFLWRKSKSTRVLFAGGWVGACTENSLFLRKYPLKEDKVFSESTPLDKQNSKFKILLFP